MVRFVERRIGVPVEAARLLKVRAVTPHGAVLPTIFPLPLDGILAAVARERRIGINRTVDHHVEDLPLLNTARVTLRRVGDQYEPPQPDEKVPSVRAQFGRQWVWMATCATWPGGETDLRYVHRRFDTQASETVVGRDALPSQTDVGRYKAWRIPVVSTVTPEFTWWALGDRDGVASLLDWRVGVGKRRRSGEGVVSRWVVEDAGPPDLDRIWWHDHSEIARPIPARAAGVLGLDHPDTVPHQLRPPYWRPPQTVVEGGGFARASREVVAPWTLRPSNSTPG